MINSDRIKEILTKKGADLCGIAPVARFKDAPSGFHPLDVFPDCKSVIVFASYFPLSTLQAKTNSPYTFIRNMMVDKLDKISFQLSIELEKEGVIAIPIPSSEPYDYWDYERQHGRGIISLKHAGFLAGLGILGKNTLLINDEYGTMIWLGANLVSIDLEPDLIATYQACVSKCTLCIDSCPQNALDGLTINQKACREKMFTYSEGGGLVLSCNICRKVCPHHAGLYK